MKPLDLFSHWKHIRSDLKATIDLFEEGELSYKAFDGCWSAGHIMLHIASAEDGWFRYAVSRELDEWPRDYVLDDYPSKDAIKNVLIEVHARTEAYLGSLEGRDLRNTIETPWGSNLQLSWIIWHVLEHEIHHRGELSLILGLLGREGPDI